MNGNMKYFGKYLAALALTVLFAAISAGCGDLESGGISVAEMSGFADENEFNGGEFSEAGDIESEQRALSEQDLSDFFNALKEHAFYLPDPASDKPADGTFSVYERPDPASDKPGDDEEEQSAPSTSAKLQLPDPASDRPSSSDGSPPIPKITPIPPKGPEKTDSE